MSRAGGEGGLLQVGKGDVGGCSLVFRAQKYLFFFFFRWTNISASLQVFLLQGLTEHIPLAMLFEEKVITSLGSLRGNCALWRYLLVARGLPRWGSVGLFVTSGPSARRSEGWTQASPTTPHSQSIC